MSWRAAHGITSRTITRSHCRRRNKIQSTRRGKYVDYVPRFLSAHHPEGCLGKQKRSLQVHTHGRVPLLFGDFKEQRALQYRGIVHQDVYLPADFKCQQDKPVDSHVIGQIDHYVCGLPSLLGDIINNGEKLALQLFCSVPPHPSYLPWQRILPRSSLVSYRYCFIRSRARWGLDRTGTLRFFSGKASSTLAMEA